MDDQHTELYVLVPMPVSSVDDIEWICVYRLKEKAMAKGNFYWASDIENHMCLYSMNPTTKLSEFLENNVITQKQNPLYEWMPSTNQEAKDELLKKVEKQIDV